MILLADIGGTHIRLARATPGGAPQSYRKNRVDAFAGIAEAIAWYLSFEKEDREAVDAFYLAFSNRNSWDASSTAIKLALPRARFFRVNDFEANAHGIPAMGPADLQVLRPAGDVPAGSSRILMGAGTGLGLACIVGAGDRTMVQQTHGAHMMPPLMTDEQHAIMAAVTAEKKTATAPIYEDIASGPGLYAVYRALCSGRKIFVSHDDAHAVIADHQTDVCAQALRIFHEVLGIFASQAVSFAYGYGGIYLTGGIIDRIMAHGAFDQDSFFRFFNGDFVPVVQRDLGATPVYWVRDEFISLKGLALYAARASDD